MSTAHLSSARRTPVQERSAARVERMLDAAAALLDDVGADALTTSAVARRAGVSVGSLYQFFPDLPAVLHALAQRSHERYRAALAERLAARPPKSWQVLVGDVVDAYVAFARTEPGFRLLSLGGPLGTRAPQAYDNGLVADALADVLRGAVPDVVVTTRLAQALRVAVESGDAVLALAFRRDPDGDPALVQELTRFLVAGLADVVETRADLPG